MFDVIDDCLPHGWKWTVPNSKDKRRFHSSSSTRIKMSTNPGENLQPVQQVQILRVQDTTHGFTILNLNLIFGFRLFLGVYLIFTIGFMNIILDTCQRITLDYNLYPLPNPQSSSFIHLQRGGVRLRVLLYTGEFLRDSLHQELALPKILL